MTRENPATRWIIWAAGGRTWGFRFLLKGGQPDPLATYERAFSGLEEEPQAWRTIGTHSALRFPDPEGRRDAANRPISHDFVLLARKGREFDTFEQARDAMWALVDRPYGDVWDAETPPKPEDLRFAS